MDQPAAQKGGLHTDDEFERLLQREHVSPLSLRRQWERQFLYDRVRLHVVNNVHITDDEARTYYHAHRAEFALASFEQSRAQINGALLTADRHAREWTTYMNALHAQAAIEWHDEHLRREYEEQAERRRDGQGE